MSEVFPEKFTYDEQSKELTVEFVDGSVVRYFFLLTLDLRS